jgi:tetratricopeptide (TPR) repeat protein
MLNNLAGQLLWLWRLSWPVHIFARVSIVFMLPSVLLGMISPVVARMVLARGLPPGRTVGDIYAAGAAGSIAGTFATGYYLIATVGSIANIWIAAGILLLMAILYWARLQVLYVWLLLLLCLMSLGIAPWTWARNIGGDLGLRSKPDPNILYEKESQYCYVSVRRLSELPDRRLFMQDKLEHSVMIMGQVTDLQYEYTQIHAAVTHRLSRGKDKLQVLVIGGGGYTFPRYIESVWPKSNIEVVEIDPTVTEAAMEAFGLQPDTSIRTFNMDARNYVDQLLRRRSAGLTKRYDFIYEDALNDYSVPYQLTTKEFNDDIARLLHDDGVYMVELIDIYDSGLFVGAYVNTLEQTFSNVYVITTADRLRWQRNTFVVVAANRPLDLGHLAASYKPKCLDLWQLSSSQIAELKQKARLLILTDDYAPVENLLAPVVRQSQTAFLEEGGLALAKALAQQGRFDEMIERCNELVRHEPAAAAKVYAEIGLLLAGSGRVAGAIEALQKALDTIAQSGIDGQAAGVHHNLSRLLKQNGADVAATEHLNKAIESFRREMELYPYSATLRAQLGDALAAKGDFKSAADAFTDAVRLNPVNPANYMKLAQTLELCNRADEAITALQRGLEFIRRYDYIDTAVEFERYIERLKDKNRYTQ